MKLASPVLALLVAAAIAVSAAAAGIAETIKLTPRNASGVTGTATVASPHDTAAAAVRVNVRGLTPDTFVRVQLSALNGKRQSASTVLILSARADARGAVVASGRVRYRGEPVTFATIADGAHAISVVSGGKVVARGVVPGMD